MILPTTLCLSAAATVINIWLSARIGMVRAKEKIGMGDGGNPVLYARMRAHSNFIEQTPIVLILIAVVEMAGKGGIWLAPLGAVFMLGRVAHAYGMDGKFKAGRPLAMVIGLIVQIVLVVVAVLASLGRI